ncbi:MAG: LEA type 2 family protein [Bacteroidia bacterium]
MKKILFFIFCTILLTSCGDFQEVTFSGIQNVNIISLSQKGAEAEITAKIKNPNNVAFTIYPADMDVTLGGINAGKAHLTGRTKIKANSDESYTFRVKSDFSSLSMADLPKLMAMAMSRNVTVSLKGNLKVGKLLVRKSYPVEMTQNVPLSKN